jgi:hypothetical protein
MIVFLATMKSAADDEFNSGLQKSHPTAEAWAMQLIDTLPFPAAADFRTYLSHNSTHRSTIQSDISTNW